MLAGRAGNVALIFALLTPLLVLAAGGAIDVTEASMRQAALQSAADAAATAAVSRYSPGYQAANLLLAGGSVPDAVTYANTLGVFSANWSSPKDTTAPVLTGGSCGGATIVCRQGTSVNSVVTVKASFAPSFLGIVGLAPGFQGIQKIQLQAVAKATAATPTYINYYIIVDTSQSMGIAATATDMQNLYNRVIAFKNSSGGEAGCVFGCHVKEEDAYNYQTGTYVQSALQTYTNEDLAHNISKNFGPYITLRIDSAVTAIQTIITQAQQSSGGFANIKLGIYEMNHAPGTGTYYNTVSSPSADYLALNTLAASIDIGNNNQYGYGDTDFDDELSSIQSVIPANGSGTTPANPTNYVFIVTDGLSDNSGGSLNNHPTAAFNPADCSAMKTNATVGVIYTTYTPIYNNNIQADGPESNYAGLVAPYSNAIPTNLKACTSDPSQFYFEASDGPALVTAMQKLFAATQKVAHLAQ